MARELLKLAASGKAKVVGKALARAARRGGSRGSGGSISRRTGELAASFGKTVKGGLSSAGDIGENFAKGMGGQETGREIGRRVAQAGVLAGGAGLALSGRNKLDEWRYNHNFGGRYAQQQGY